MYAFLPSFLLGFHGCDATVGEAILAGAKQHLTFSTNDYDWLGNGVYFWEGNPARALQFAHERSAGGKNSRGRVTQPFVLGAIINLHRCLDLADSGAIAQVKHWLRRLPRSHRSQRQAAAHQRSQSQNAAAGLRSIQLAS